jgi:hypothetical protein
MMFYADKSETIDNIKHTIQDKGGIPVNQQLLIFGRRLLKDNSTLSDCHIWVLQKEPKTDSWDEKSWELLDK